MTKSKSRGFFLSSSASKTTRPNYLFRFLCRLFWGAVERITSKVLTTLFQISKRDDVLGRLYIYVHFVPLNDYCINQPTRSAKAMFGLEICDFCTVRLCLIIKKTRKNLVRSSYKKHRCSVLYLFTLFHFISLYFTSYFLPSR